MLLLFFVNVLAFFCIAVVWLFVHIWLVKALSLSLLLIKVRDFLTAFLLLLPLMLQKKNYSSWLHSVGMLVFCFNASRTCYFDFAPTLKQITYFAVGRMRPE